MSLLTNWRHWPFCKYMPACNVGMIRNPVTNKKLLPAWGKEHMVYK